MDKDIGQKQADFVAENLVTQLNLFHSYEQPYDDNLDADLFLKYSNRLNKSQFFDFKNQPYFSPSSANSCDLELYMKVKKAERDTQEITPHQRRWNAIGTAVGDTIQREILLYERHMKRFTGQTPIFRFERTENGEPMFEDFAKKMTILEHKSKRFSLYGTCDGIMLFTTPSGKTVRVGLEVKSKQTTYTQTGDYHMKGPQENNVKQCICYSVMYNVDYYVILYVNTAHKGWYMSEEDVEKYPDIRAFGVYITEDMRKEVLDKFANVLDYVDRGEHPPIDLSKFTFNKFKKACANVISDEEIDTLQSQVNQAKRSNLPTWQKEQYTTALNRILELRDHG